MTTLSRVDRTHTDDCVHLPNSHAEDCRPINGVWNQSSWFDDARWELPEEAPYCRILDRAWALQNEEEQ